VWIFAVDGVMPPRALHLGRAAVLAFLYSLFACSLASGAARAVQPVALFKTHKTASTTWGGLLFRYALARDLRVFSTGDYAGCFPYTPKCSASHVLSPLPAPRPADVVLHHVSEVDLKHPVPMSVPFSDLFPWYRSVLGSELVVLVPIRDAVDHWLSFVMFCARTPRLL
jgi:hypothetical protein